MNQQTTPSANTHKRKAHRPYLLLGVLWLALAAVVLITEWRRPPTIVLDWETETEFETAGFNVYRSQATNGGCDTLQPADYVQINTQLIPSSADPSAGATYRFEDASVEPGTRYCYQLEDVEFSQATERHPPFVGEVQRVQWMALLIAAGSVVAGVALLTAGFKREIRQ